jgi:hypothetical protein
MKTQEVVVMVMVQIVDGNGELILSNRTSGHARVTVTSWKPWDG